MNIDLNKLEKRLKKIYEMLYPYGEYNYDKGFTCLAINKELKKLCNQNMRHVLLIIAKYIGYKFTPNTPLNEICKQIQEYIFNLCLDQGFDDKDKSRFIVGNITGVLEPLNEYENNCNYFINIFGNRDDYILNRLIDLYPRIEEWLILLDYKLLKDANRDDDYAIKEIMDMYGYDVKLLHNKDEQRKLFNKGLNENRLFNYNDINILDFWNKPIFKTKSQVDFINNIIESMSNGKLDIFVTWADICKD